MHILSIPSVSRAIGACPVFVLLDKSGTMTTNLLDICHSNVRSLNDEVKDAIKADLAFSHDIIMLTETNLPHDQISDFSISGFQNIIRKDRVGRTGGGIAMYVADHLGAIRMSEFELPDLEALWVKVKAGHNVILFCTCYRPPDAKADFWVTLQDSLDLAKHSGISDIVLAGDFNADPSTREGQLLNIFCRSNDLFCHVNEPTRITDTTATILDQFISSRSTLLTDVAVYAPIAKCDHCPIRAVLKTSQNYPKPKAYSRHIWQYDLANFEEFKRQLSNVDWNDCFKDGVSLDEACNLWIETFLNIARNCIPNKVVIVRPGDKPFFNKELRKMRRKKNIAHRKAKRSNKPADWEQFRKMRNEYNLSIKNAKANSEQTRAEKLRDKESLSPKKWWRLAKSFLQKDGKKSAYPPLKVGDDLVCDDKSKAEVFNDFFASSSKLEDSHVPKPDSTCNVERVLDKISIQEKDIADLLKCLDISKATGPDQISQVMLKKAGDSIVPSLTQLFNLSLERGVFPSKWKKANVTPIHKKNDNAVVDNYRPVSLLSCVGKLFEKAVFKYVFNFLRDTGAISLKQSGFMPGDSTVYQLTHLYHLFSEAINNQKIVRMVFCDISKAFDRVWHTGLLAKLSRVGITGNLLKWFENYLSNREQRVVINGQSSEWKHIKAGVPQGSVLGPLLFLIFINDITNEVQSSEVRLFADDTILYVIADNPTESVDALNNDLQRIKLWADKWLVKFSPPKTKSLTLSKKQKQRAPPLTFGNTPIEEIDSHKHLGVTLSHNLSWGEHIDDTIASAGKRVDVLNALKFKLDRETLERLYLAFVRSKLEYASIVWDNCTNEQRDLIEQVQYRAGKIVSGAINRTSKDIVYQELGWHRLAERRQNQRLKVFHKIVNGKTPGYLQSEVPVADPNRENLRNAEHIPRIRGKVFFENTFFPKTIKEWNDLDNDTKSVESNETFASRIKRAVNVPKWYYTGERSPAIWHARMRMMCSPLNDHLYAHVHVIDDPHCACGYRRENNKHFLLDCPLFANERTPLLTELDKLKFKPVVKNLLFGNAQYTDESNFKAFTFIQKFIKSTGRFD